MGEILSWKVFPKSLKTTPNPQESLQAYANRLTEKEKYVLCKTLFEEGVRKSFVNHTRYIQFCLAISIVLNTKFWIWQNPKYAQDPQRLDHGYQAAPRCLINLFPRPSFQEIESQLQTVITSHIERNPGIPFSIDTLFQVPPHPFHISQAERPSVVNKELYSPQSLVAFCMGLTLKISALDT
jgi:hypothetical protein